MKAIINIDLVNAAFHDGAGPGIELGRILKDLANKVIDHPSLEMWSPLPLFDVNGNKVGSLTIKIRRRR
jgi:hypothetical protein